MGPSESGIQSNSWVPTDDAPPNTVVEEMPPISGANKVYSHISSLMAFDVLIKSLYFMALCI